MTTPEERAATAEVRLAEALAERDEAYRRRDAWRAKAEGYDALAAAVRAGIEEAGTRNLGRVFLRGALVDSEKRLAEALERVAAMEATLEPALRACATIDAAVAEGHDSVQALLMHLLSAADDARAALRGPGT